MLVLTRRCGEEIVVPELNLVFRIQEVHGGRVRIGIMAPEDVGVFRREVWERGHGRADSRKSRPSAETAAERA